jgi:hypothetical protein
MTRRLTLRAADPRADQHDAAKSDQQAEQDEWRKPAVVAWGKQGARAEHQGAKARQQQNDPDNDHECRQAAASGRRRHPGGGLEQKAGPVSGEGFRRRSRLQLLVSCRFPGHAGANAIDAAVTIKQVVGVERNDLAPRLDEMNAGALDVADAEIEAIEKLHDGDAEHVLVAEIGRGLEGRQAAQEFGQALAGVERPRRE